MVYFLTPTEGGQFIRIVRPSLHPATLVRRELLNEKCIAVFENGMVYDGYLPERYGTKWRDKLSGREEGRNIYNHLLTLDLPEEQITTNKEEEQPWITNNF